MLPGIFNAMLTRRGVQQAAPANNPARPFHLELSTVATKKRFALRRNTSGVTLGSRPLQQYPVCSHQAAKEVHPLYNATKRLPSRRSHPGRCAPSPKLPVNHFWLCLGSQIKNVVPVPGRVSKLILPSCASTHDFAIDKPSPVPVRFS
jgi:hypothetical protein